MFYFSAPDRGPESAYLGHLRTLGIFDYASTSLRGIDSQPAGDHCFRLVSVGWGGVEPRWIGVNSGDLGGKQKQQADEREKKKCFWNRAVVASAYVRIYILLRERLIIKTKQYHLGYIYEKGT
jgi:hypothetical protein